MDNKKIPAMSDLETYLKVCDFFGVKPQEDVTEMVIRLVPNEHISIETHTTASFKE